MNEREQRAFWEKTFIAVITGAGVQAHNFNAHAAVLRAKECADKALEVRLADLEAANADAS